MKSYPKTDSTVVISDIRNFTHLFEIFQKDDDPGFLRFMEEYYSLGGSLAELVSEGNGFYLKSAGDGILAIFFGEHHARRAYLYGLLLFQLLEIRCSAFNQQHDCTVSFGIGIETGYVQKVSCGVECGTPETYLGSVINIAARLEAKTKDFHRTKLILGEKVYKRLVQKLFTEEYNHLVERSEALRKNYDEVIAHHNEMNKLNQNLMLFYLFEHSLKGVDQPMPLFRLSPTLADMRKTSFLNVIKCLTFSPEHYQRVVLFIEENSAPAASL
jgi:class 3 adenylate cyclase